VYFSLGANRLEIQFQAKSRSRLQADWRQRRLSAGQSTLVDLSYQPELAVQGGHDPIFAPMLKCIRSVRVHFSLGVSRLEMEFQAKSRSRLQADWRQRRLSAGQSTLVDLSYQPEIPFQGGRDPDIHPQTETHLTKRLLEFQWVRVYTADESEPWLIQAVGFTRGESPFLNV